MYFAMNVALCYTGARAREPDDFAGTFSGLPVDTFTSVERLFANEIKASTMELFPEHPTITEIKDTQLQDLICQEVLLV